MYAQAYRYYNGNRKTIWIIAGVALAIYIIYRYGKKMGMIFIPDVAYDKKSIEESLKNWNPNTMADEFYKVLNGFGTLATTRNAVYQKAAALTDTQLAALYNTFNKKYSAKGGLSLTAWIDDEWFMSTAETNLLNRLNTLRLT